MLSYFYHNQNFEVIKSEINENNVANLYSMAYVMKADRLKQDIEDMIITEIINPMNCTQFYLEGIRFKSDKISDACEDLIVENF